VPQAPWHGYQLGDWDKEYTGYADAAVAGNWRQNGKSTFDRRQGNLIPETPVRSMAAPKKK
jgi:4-hydroxy-3-polyprenylbenzoate decarboxylase